MIDTMSYKGYTATVELDEDAGLLVGHVLDLGTDGINFQGQSVAEARKSFHDSVDFYLEGCKKDGVEPDKPYSGKFVLRLYPELHRTITLCARRAGLSLNAWVIERLERAAAQQEAKTRHGAKARKGKRHAS